MAKERRHISLPPELWPRLEAVAGKQSRSLNNLIEVLLTDALTRLGDSK